MNDRMLDLGRRLLAESEVEGVLSAALDGVIELIGAERGFVLLYRDDGEVLYEEARQVAHRDLERPTVEHPELEVSRSIVERVRREGQPFFHENVLADPELGERESVRRLAILSVLCQPIVDRGRPLGLLYLDNRRAAGVFDAEKAAAVASFAEFISAACASALERRRLTQEITELRAQLGGGAAGEILTRDPAMLAAIALLTRAAPSRAPVLLRGETGTGKELAARALHALSPRRARPFIALNCGALPPTLFEAELFGSVRGAFTGAEADKPGWFERAHGGTLFLDEVAELPVELQPKLLRALESGELARVGSTQPKRVDVRLVAATHRDLEAMVAAGTLRGDLLYRLNTVEVRLPPLRERQGDVALLTRAFLDRLRAETGLTRTLSPAAEAALAAYGYPGNVRELKNALHRAALVAEGETIGPRDLPPAFTRQREARQPQAPLAFAEAKEQVVSDFERRYVADCLRASEGNIRRAARMAGLDYKNFYTKMAGYGIDPRAFKPDRP